jgi:hypothetical protein
MRVLTGDQVLIGGFIITGTDLKRVIIRGMGPSLNGVGVTLSDPTLELHQGSMMLAPPTTTGRLTIRPANRRKLTSAPRQFRRLTIWNRQS